jgi:hypothetical protein
MVYHKLLRLPKDLTVNTYKRYNSGNAETTMTACSLVSGSQICWSKLENHPPTMNHKSDILPNKLITHLIHVAEEIQLQSI